MIPGAWHVIQSHYDAFGPRDISGLQFWLDAAYLSAFTLDGFSNISQGNDKSGFDRHAVQGNSNNRPTWLANQLNGLGAIKGNGTNHWLEALSFPSLANGYTIYAVSESSGASNSALASINAGVNNSAMVIGNDSTVGSYVSSWGAAVAQPAPAAGTNFARMVKYDGAHTAGGFRIRLSTRTSDTTGTMTQAVGTPPAGTLNILRASTTYSGRNLYELMIWNRQTTTDEDALLKAYITAKWGLAWS
jgi:hypothetical protein